MPLSDRRNITRFLLARVFAVVLCMALALCVPVALALPATPPISLRQDGPLLVVSSPFYVISIRPDSGGKIVSCTVNGVEMTRLCPDGRGGLMEEVQTAGLPFEVLKQAREEDRIVLVLAADAGDLGVVKHYTFQADRPWFVVRLLFQNRSHLPLAGASAPALRHLVIPGGGGSAGQQLYCMDRGRGAEILSPEILLTRLHGESAPRGALRWAAVAEPASRRVLGFALSQAGCSPLSPMRTDEGGMTFGWSYPTIPPGHSLAASVVVAPLEGFTAVSELNERFALDSLPDTAGDLFTVHVSIMALQAQMKGLSVITRTFDHAGRELAPCTPLLFDTLEPMKHYRGDVTRTIGNGKPAWLVHEIYSEGARVSGFAVPVGEVKTGFPGALPKPEPPVFEPIEGFSPPAPGSLIPLTESEQERGLMLWRFDGAPARRQAQELDLALTHGERKTLFLGVKAPRPVEKLRLTLAGLAVEQAGLHTLPPAAAYLWQVNEDGPAGAVLTPLTELSLQAGQVVWLALTADAAHLQPGGYAARLVASTDRSIMEIPLRLHVLGPARQKDGGQALGGSPNAFGLWYLGDGTGSSMPALALAKLAGYGVSGLTVAAQDNSHEIKPEDAVADAQRVGLSLLAFASRGGVLPPSRPSLGLMQLPYAQPVWLLRAWGAPSGAARAAADAGYAPAVLCERLTSLPKELLARPRLVRRPSGGQSGRAEDGMPPESLAASRDAIIASSLPTPPARIPFWLVQDGCEPGRVAKMTDSGIMDGPETVWLYLDLREANWQRAATEVRNAAWAAAWQGLAGVAVSCAAPRPEVDQQLALWHILRDACGEVALWREARRAADRLGDAAAAAAEPGARKVLLVGMLDSIVGLADHCDLVLKPQPAPGGFRTIYRVAPPPGGQEVTLGQFAAARRKVLELRGQIEIPALAPRPEKPYWGRAAPPRDG